MPDFNASTPPPSITNPKGPAQGYHEYPRHLHKPDGTYCVVMTDDEKAAQLAAGWQLQPGPAPEKPKAEKSKADKG